MTNFFGLFHFFGPVTTYHGRSSWWSKALYFVVRKDERGEGKRPWGPTTPFEDLPHFPRPPTKAHLLKFPPPLINSTKQRSKHLAFGGHLQSRLCLGPLIRYLQAGV